jgi:hypothetical protein
MTETAEAITWDDQEREMIVQKYTVLHNDFSDNELYSHRKTSQSHGYASDRLLKSFFEP